MGGNVMLQMTRRQFSGSALAAAGSARATASDEPVVFELEAARNWVALDGRLVELITYNGQVPGPTMTLRPGQEAVIRLSNLLSEPTNLHFHGLHISPNPGADDVFLRIPPGEQHEYRFTVPADHPAGTFWYHPHVHGHTAEQVSGGLAGAILVRSETEAALDLFRVPEHVILLQDFDLTNEGGLAQPGQMELLSGREGSLITAAGKPNLALPLTTGGSLRLRMINASSSRFYNLKLDEHPFVLIGVDGGLLPSPLEMETILLTPGERVDVIVRGNRNPGSYRLWSMPYNRTAGMGMGGPTFRSSGPFQLARIEYESADQPLWQLPERLAAIDPLPGNGKLRRFSLAQSMGVMGMPGRARGGMAFTINGRTFDMDRVDTQVQLGDVEDWEFVNNTSMDHPMHVHTNPFQIVQSDGSAIPAWKDTVLVRTGRRVRMRTRFDAFTGLAVYHCHILDHEDMGMMGTLRIT
jgi:FtsP/CotA-like multicopper oxidase with cupredoxin domain